MLREHKVAEVFDPLMDEASGSDIDLLASRGDERRNSPDMRFRAAKALLKETLALCQQSPDQLLRTAFRSALTHVIESHGLQDKDRGLQMA